MSKPSLARATSFSAILSAVALFVTFATGVMFGQGANCTFKTFNPPSGYIYGFYPNGINHWNTVVGGVWGPNQNTEKAFVRWASGGMTLFSVPNATWTQFNRRNLNGTSVGAYGFGTSSLPPAPGSNGLIYTSSSYATLNYPGSPSTALSGMNKWNTIIGNELDPVTNGTWGFKYQHGTWTQIRYPGSVQTMVNGINDNGVIVGQYQMGNFQSAWAGFILQNGKFTSLNVVPSDINNSGLIVAGNQIRFPDGKTEIIYLPGSASTDAMGVNDLGIISGNATYGSFEFQGFTATCKE